MKEWSHLPNAHHIDWVLASLKETPELWGVTWSAARGAARGASWDASWDAAVDAARDAAMSAARNATWNAARGAGWAAGWGVISALVSYDDCDQFLAMSYERLKVWAVLSEDPRAILLLPMVYVKEKLNEQSMVTSA